MHLTDTHCHIHSNDYGLSGAEVVSSALDKGVTRMLCVGTDLNDSRLAANFVQSHENCWATIGLHPHESAIYASNNEDLQQFAKLVTRPKVVAIGETGLDYYYNYSPKHEQQKILRFQIELALEHNLPLIFHIREAFSDFWKIFDEYENLTGVVHSFSASRKELDEVLSRGLYVGLNGIMTFTGRTEQLEAAKQIPLQKLLLETDAPYLTPVPFRGTICQPKHVRVIAEFLAGLRGESLDDLAASTTQNAATLFSL